MSMRRTRRVFMYIKYKKIDMPKAGIETKAILKACIKAQASSEIENIVTTTDRHFLYANEADKHSQIAQLKKLGVIGLL